MHWCLSATMVCLLVVCVTVPATAQDRFGDPLPEGAVQRLGTLRMKTSAADIRYLPDGRGVIALGTQIYIWDLEKGEQMASHQVADSSVRCMEVSEDGSRFLFANSAGNVVEWSLATGERTHLFPTGQSRLRWAFYSPDETRVLTTGSVPPTLKEWDLATGEELVSIEGDIATFVKAIYGPGGTTAFVGGGFDTILVHYDLTTGVKLNEWFTNYKVYDLCLSPDGERLLVASRSMATEWQIDGYEELQRFKGHHGGAVNGVSYCHEPEQILTGSRDGSIRRWDRVEAEVLLRWFPHESYANITRISPDGERVLSYGAGLVAESSLATGEPSLSWERHAGAVYGGAFTPDGLEVVSASADGTLRVWDVATGESVLVIEGATLGAWSLAVSPDGTTAVAGCKDGMVREFDLASGDLVREMAGHLGYVRSVAYSNDGELILSSAGDGSVRVWARDQDEPVAVLEGHRGGALAVAISPDDDLAVSGGRDGTVRIWDLAEGALLETLTGHRGWVEAVIFVDGGQSVVSAGRDGRVIVWDVASGEMVREMAHGGWVHGLACSPDGSVIYSTAGAVACWDLATGEKTAELSGHAKTVNAVAVSPDGNLLVTASSDTTLLIWENPGQ